MVVNPISLSHFLKKKLKEKPHKWIIVNYVETHLGGSLICGHFAKYSIVISSDLHTLWHLVWSYLYMGNFLPNSYY